MKSVRAKQLFGPSLILLIAACGASSNDGQIEDGADGGIGSTPDAGAPTADAHPAASMHAVYAHSSTTLYRLNPDTLGVEVVGAFAGCSSVVDIALDKDSNLFGTTFSGLYKIDIGTAACTLISTGAYPNSLSFVPAGVLDANKEVLVAYTGSQYQTIDIETGIIKNLGTIEGGYASSGDVVSVEGGGTFLTASGPNCDDCLLEIDPATGGLLKNWGQLGFSAVFGLAYWGGVAYGFDDTGAAFSIEFGASTVTTTSISIPSAPPGLSFWGAGSTTQAPVID
jgi:hypothetical protein